MGALKLNAVFSNGMVLQRDKEIKVWGIGADGETVSVSLCGHTACAVVSGGKWEASLPAMPAAEVAELTVSSGGDSIFIHDVAIGEVWIAGGQSNMEMLMMFDAEVDSATDSDPLFRFFDVPKISYVGQENDVSFADYGFWRSCDPKNTPHFSAAGYYYGKKLRAALNVPVGIVGCNCGGTSASCWVPEEDLRSDSELYEYIEDYEKGIEGRDLKKLREDYINERRRQQTPDARAFHKRMMLGTLTEKERLDCTAASEASPQVIGPEHHYRPVALYHLMLATIAPYTARGVIWYQGESDDRKPKYYAKLFTKLIARWRGLWRDELPFLFVQLAPFESWLACRGTNFPLVREQQELVSKTVAGTYMASIMDSGDRLDVHPKYKRPVGERLARLAMNKIYGFDVPSDAPEAVSCVAIDGGAEVRFANCGEGLVLNGERVNSLQIFGADGEINDFTERVEGDRLVITASGDIREVRFAWLPYAAANLYGNDGLCAKPFKLAVTQ